MPKRIFSICIVVMVSVFSAESLDAQEINTDCAEMGETGDDASLNLILRSDDGIITGSGEILIAKDSLPESFGTFFDPLSHQILIWSRVASSSDTDEDELVIDVWNLDGQGFIVSDLHVPNSFRALQWLDNNQFLFEDWATDSLIILSLETEELTTLLETTSVPTMRLIPITSPRTEYDISLSPDQKYLAYENNDINRDISIWDIEEEVELSQFVGNLSSVPLESHPTWSHNSRYLALADFVETEMQLFLYDTEMDQQSQLTELVSYPAEIEKGRPFASIHSIDWSLNDRYIAIQGTFFDIHIVNIETMTGTDICFNGMPLFWLPDNTLLIYRGSEGMFSYDVEENVIRPIPLAEGFVVGWIP